MPSVVRTDLPYKGSSWPLFRLYRCSSRRQIPAPFTAARFLRIYSAGNIIDWRLRIPVLMTSESGVVITESGDHDYS